MRTLIPLAWILATIWFVYDGRTVAWIFFVAAVFFSFIAFFAHEPSSPTNLFLGETDEN